MRLPMSYWIDFPSKGVNESTLLPLLLIRNLQFMSCGRQLKEKLCIGLKHKQS